MDKRAKIIFLVVGVLATAGVIYWLTKDAKGDDTNTVYDPNANANTGTGETPPTDGTLTVGAPPEIPPPITMPVSPAITSSKGVIAFRKITYFAGNAAAVSYFDKDMKPIVLDANEAKTIGSKIKGNKMSGLK